MAFPLGIFNTPNFYFQVKVLCSYVLYIYMYRCRCKDLSAQNLNENSPLLPEIMKFEFFLPNTGILHFIRYTVIYNYPVSILWGYFHSYTHRLQIPPTTTSQFLLHRNLLPATVLLLIILPKTGYYFTSVIKSKIVIRNYCNFNTTQLYI